MIEFYLIGCIAAFFIGWIQANEEQKLGHDVSQFGAVIIVLVVLSWIYVAYWLYWFGSGGNLC